LRADAYDSVIFIAHILTRGWGGQGAAQVHDLSYTPPLLRQEPIVKAAPSNTRPDPDKVLVQIADYVDRYAVKSAPALETARLALIDSLGCGFEALSNT
jgi:hypothetical protein